MPQLYPAPWLFMLTFTWLILLTITLKVIDLPLPNDPESTAGKPEMGPWKWPWH